MHGTVSLRSVHGKFLSAQPDGRAEWNRDESHDWEHFHVEKRHNGKITLKGVHGMYLSAQPDGSVQINRREAPEGGWEEFTVEDRGSDVVCLKSSHGKYLSAQQNGTAQWNRDHAPPGGWEDIQIEYRGSNSKIHDEEAIRLFKKTLDDHGVPSDFLAGTQTSRGQPTRGQPARAEPSRIQPAPVQPSVETSSIDILEAVSSKPVRFKINNPPRSNDAWVGIYPAGAPDQDHGEQNKRWKWLHDMNVNDATLPPQAEGNWSIRIFSDGGFTLHERKDFFMLADGHPLPPSSTSRSPKRESIEILEAVPGKPVRFRINDVPSSNDAWVGIYHPSSSDQEIGKQKQQWEWLRDLDVNNASLPEKYEGNWSIRVFSDGGYDLHSREDFDITPASKKWWEDR